MKLPRDISAQDLVKKLQTLGYVITRQSGSHIRLTTNQFGQHHLTIPHHHAIKVGTLSAILTDVAAHFQKSKEEIISMLFQ